MSTTSTNQLTPTFMGDLAILMPEARAAGDYFVSPRTMEAIRREAAPTTEQLSRILGMEVFVMENQKADTWIISDPNLAAAYRKGIAPEEMLEQMRDRNNTKTTE